MFIDMILKTIPRSIRAGVALVLTFMFLGAGFNELSTLLSADKPSLWLTVKCVGGLLLGSAAAICFYYFQAQDGGNGHYSDLPTLNRHYKDEQARQRIEGAEVTPVFSSHEGEIKPESADSAQRR